MSYVIHIPENFVNLLVDRATDFQKFEAHLDAVERQIKVEAWHAKQNASILDLKVQAY